ncbi:MAG: hypothetical protein COB24_08985 [Hyphomicrobiales bacterium]|nr:MAG: hypothetical protein COB24_08985 [Hyphomicrobiales bacterium]
MVVVKARLLNGGNYTDMKLMTQGLVARLGDMSKAARWTRVNKQTIGRYCNTNGDHVDHYMPFDVIADLEKAGEFPIIGEYLVNLQGYSLYRDPKTGCGHRGLKQLSKMMNEFSVVFDGVVESHEDDGLISADEIIEHKLIEALTKLATDVLSMKADYIAKVENDE